VFNRTRDRYLMKGLPESMGPVASVSLKESQGRRTY
jgi:hypothetical protein